MILSPAIDQIHFYPPCPAKNIHETRGDEGMTCNEPS